MKKIVILIILTFLLLPVIAQARWFGSGYNGRIAAINACRGTNGVVVEGLIGGPHEGQYGCFHLAEPTPKVPTRKPYLNREKKKQQSPI